MADREIGDLRQTGIYPYSLDTIRSRFTAKVTTGYFGREIADHLFVDSWYQGDRFDARYGILWMALPLVDIEDRRVVVFIEVGAERLPKSGDIRNGGSIRRLKP